MDHNSYKDKRQLPRNHSSIMPKMMNPRVCTPTTHPIEPNTDAAREGLVALTSSGSSWDPDHTHGALLSARKHVSDASIRGSCENKVQRHGEREDDVQLAGDIAAHGDSTISM